MKNSKKEEAEMTTCSDIFLGFTRFMFLGLAVTVGAIYISKSPMLESLRRRVDRLNRWIGYALKCSYCMSGWISLLYISIYMPLFLHSLFNDSWYVSGVNLLQPINFVTGWLTLWGLAALYYRILWPFLEKNAPKMRVKW